eukprot:1894794-Rhodomonas_salina.1
MPAHARGLADAPRDSRAGCSVRAACWAPTLHAAACSLRVAWHSLRRMLPRTALLQHSTALTVGCVGCVGCG